MTKKNETLKIKLELNRDHFFVAWFVAAIGCLLLGAMIGAGVGKWSVFFWFLVSGVFILPLVLLLIFPLFKAWNERIYSSACKGTFVADPDKGWICEAKEIPSWDHLESNIRDTFLNLLSKKNEVLIGTSVVNIYDFSSKLKEKKLSREEINLLIRHGDWHLKNLFLRLYVGRELAYDHIEAIHETDPLWIFSFKEFTEKQLYKIIQDWNPYELQGLEVDEKEGKQKMISVDEGKYLFIKRTSDENIMNLVKLFDPDGDLIKALQEKLNGKMVIR